MATFTASVLLIFVQFRTVHVILIVGFSPSCVQSVTTGSFSTEIISLKRLARLPHGEVLTCIC